jgi:hypothetical protein
VHFPPSKTLNHRTRPRLHCVPYLHQPPLRILLHLMVRLPFKARLLGIPSINSSICLYAPFLSSHSMTAHQY